MEGGLEVQYGQLRKVEESLLPQKVEALRFHFLLCNRIGCEEANPVNGADVEDRGGQAKIVGVFAEGVKECVCNVVIPLTWVLYHC